MLVHREEENLGLVHHPAEGFAVEDAVPVPLEFRAVDAFLLGSVAAFRMLAEKGAGREGHAFAFVEDVPDGAAVCPVLRFGVRHASRSVWVGVIYIIYAKTGSITFFALFGRKERKAADRAASLRYGADMGNDPAKRRKTGRIPERAAHQAGDARSSIRSS